MTEGRPAVDTHGAPAQESTADRAQAFFTEARALGAVWTIRDDEELAPLLTPDGERVVPFWSSPARAHRFVNASRDHLSYHVAKVPLAEWRLRRWYPSLRRDHVKARLNWSARGDLHVDVSARELDAGLFPPSRPVSPR